MRFTLATALHAVTPSRDSTLCGEPLTSVQYAAGGPVTCKVSGRATARGKA